MSGAGIRGESDAAIELEVAGESLFEAGYSDEDVTHVVVADLFEAGNLRPSASSMMSSSVRPLERDAV